MDNRDICLVLGREAENVITNPFSADAKVEWLLGDAIAPEDFSYTSDENGSLKLALWPDQDDLELELVCKNEDGQSCQYRVSLFRLPSTLELPAGEWGEINYPGDLWNPVLKQVSSQLFELESNPDNNCLRVKGLEPGYEDIKLCFDNGEIGSVYANVGIRIFEQTTYKARDDEPSFQGDCLMTVYKKGEQSSLQALRLSTTGSIIVGRSSASVQGFADIDLRPFLSEEAQTACSRRQLKVLITKDKKLCVENIGSVPVKIDDKYDLEPALSKDQAAGSSQQQPRALVILPPGSSVTIADEIVLLFKDEKKGV